MAEEKILEEGTTIEVGGKVQEKRRSNRFVISSRILRKAGLKKKKIMSV